jgi:hypothetical protein
MAHRRFPPSWSIEELNDACFVVRDANGQQLAYVYFQDEPGRRSAAKLPRRDDRAGSRVARVTDLDFLIGRCVWPHFSHLTSQATE